MFTGTQPLLGPGVNEPAQAAPSSGSKPKDSAVARHRRGVEVRTTDDRAGVGVHDRIESGSKPVVQPVVRLQVVHLGRAVDQRYLVARGCVEVALDAGDHASRVPLDVFAPDPHVEVIAGHEQKAVAFGGRGGGDVRRRIRVVGLQQQEEIERWLAFAERLGLRVLQIGKQPRRRVDLVGEKRVERVAILVGRQVPDVLIEPRAVAALRIERRNRRDEGVERQDRQGTEVPGLIVAVEVLEVVEVGVNGARRAAVPENCIAIRDLVRHIRIVVERVIMVFEKAGEAAATREVAVVGAQALFLAVLERDRDVAATVVDVLPEHAGEEHCVGVTFSGRRRIEHVRRIPRSRASG